MNIASTNSTNITTNSNKRIYIVFGVILALPALLTLFIFAQLYATLMRF